jgi:hypothetical protein
VYQATAWIASPHRLLLYGGIFVHFCISDSVFEAEDNEDDIQKADVSYDSELYSFDLFAVSKQQWTRLRVPTQRLHWRSFHTLNELDGKLVVLGGSVVAGGTRGLRDERDYNTDVLRFDLDMPSPIVNVPQKEQANHNRKGKRKGKKKK